MSVLLDILMPRLSDSMTEGTILSWLKAPGDAVARGEDLVEIETDKAQMTYQAEKAGVLAEIVAQEGDTVALGEPIARLQVEGQDAPAPSTPEFPEELDVELEAADQQATPEPVHELESDYQQAALDAERAAVREARGARDRQIQEAQRVIVSPAARVRADQQGIDLQSVSGSGPGGRIVLADLDGIGQQTVEALAEPVTGAAVRPASRIESLIARRMLDGKSAPEFPAERDIHVDALLDLRRQLKATPGLPAVPSLNDFIVRAVALALRQHPRLRSVWTDQGIVEHQQINVGVAVATEQTLLVPVVRHTDVLPVSALAAQTRQLADQARAGSLSAADMEGGTFTVSNLGGMGVTRFQAVLVPGQSGILAVGSARAEVRWGEQGPERQTLLSLTLTSDHRVVYGAHAAAFLQTLAELLEQPLSLLS